MKRLWAGLLVCMWMQAEGGRKLPLSLREAAETAAAPGGAARAELAREAARAAEARKRQALAALLPNVDGGYTFRSFTNNLASFGIEFPAVPGIEFPVFAGPIDVQDARLTAGLSVFDVAAVRRWQAAKTQARAAAMESEEGQLKAKAAAAFQPAFTLSGFAFPIRNMPEPVQWLTYLNPLRYYMEIVRGVFLKGSGVEELWPQLAALAGMGVAIVALSAKRFHKRLE